MKTNKFKKKLYRKVNTKARGVYHNFGGHFRYSRHSKKEGREHIKGTMRKQHRGLDYTPLFKFLLSKVGVQWNQVYSEIKARLDTTEPIFWIVALQEDDKEDYIRIGETSYFSGLYVDEQGYLQLTNPALKATDLTPFCNCCTYTLNSIRFNG